MKLKFYIPLFIIVAGIGFCCYLQFLVPNGVYFSGDAGLKALLAKQFSSGIFRFDLISPSETWVTDLWNQGLYPYQQPFVYQVNSRYFITFPFTFPLITAPFYYWLGYRGLYLIPLVATWGVWLVFYWIGYRLKLPNYAIALGLIILIFGSFLTLYSAMYWEHSLAVFLSFLGMGLILESLYQDKLSAFFALLSGILLGFSVWFRPEFLCFNLITVVVFLSLSLFKSIFPNTIFLKQFTSEKFSQKILFITSIILTTGLFFLCNQLIYGYPTGIHGIQIIEQTSLTPRLREFFFNFKGLSLTFLQYFSIVLFSLYYFIFNFWLHKKIDWLTLSTYLISLVFILGVSLIVPTGTNGLIAGGKQWGTRFLLILLPFLSLIIAHNFMILWQSKKTIFKYTGLGILALFLILNIYKNTIQGANYLVQTHQGIRSILEYLEKSPPIIAISHQFVAQSLEPSLNHKFFFRVTTIQQLKQLALTALQQGYSELTYICYPYFSCNLIDNNTFPIVFAEQDKKIEINISPLDSIGKYLLFQLKIEFIR